MATKTSQKINLLRNKAKEFAKDARQMAEIDTLAEAAQDEYYEVLIDKGLLTGKVLNLLSENNQLRRALDNLLNANNCCNIESGIIHGHKAMIGFSTTESQAEYSKAINEAKQLLAQTPGRVGENNK